MHIFGQALAAIGLSLGDLDLVEGKPDMAKFTTKAYLPAAGQ